MDLIFVVALTIFLVSFLTIVFEFYDKAIAGIAGALMMIIVGVLSFEEAIEAIDFETISLLMGMMIMVDLASSSGVFSWLNVRLTKYTRGRPWLIFALFCLVTMAFSAFLDNVTTMLIIVPIMISLTRGMGLDSKFYVISLIFFSNLGGALTLIGDPTNIIIGTSADLSFNQFILNLAAPVLTAAVVIGSILAVTRWSTLKPISGNLRQLFVTHLLIQKIENEFGRVQLKPSFITSVLAILSLTILGFVLQHYIGLPISVIALSGAVGLLILTAQYSSVHDSLSKVEWPTIFFFAGLFVMVAGLKKVGLLDIISHNIANISDDFTVLVLIILWFSALISMLLDNVPFVTVMIPVIFQIQDTLPPEVDGNLLWWALSLGAVLGGLATPIGSSANVVSIGIAKKSGIQISFLDYLKYGLPLSITALSISSIYLLIRLS